METVCTSSLAVCPRLSIFSAPILSDGLDGERLERAFSLAQNARRVASQIDHRARLDTARSRIDHQVELALEPLADLARLRERPRLARQRQGGRKHRLVQFGEQRMRDRMSRHPDSDRLPARVRRAARYLAPRAQDEG